MASATATSTATVSGLMNAQESDIMSVLQGKLRLLPSSPKERKQKLEYITRSIHICTTAEIE